MMALNGLFIGAFVINFGVVGGGSIFNQRVNDEKKELKWVNC
jgi:hypothetical protein